MITFIVCIGLLVAGYFLYGKFIDRYFGMNPERATPACTMEDGVDYIPMPAWRIFMIQFLNIAGLLDEFDVNRSGGSQSMSR